VKALSWLPLTRNSTTSVFEHPIPLFRSLKNIAERGMSFCNKQINAPTMVAYKEPVTNLLTVTINRQRLARQYI
jgi:hypothetical protein